MKTPTVILHALMLALWGSPSLAQTVRISATDSNAAETASGFAPNLGTIRVTRTGSTATALAVWVKVSGVAVQGTDYSFGNTIG